MAAYYAPAPNAGTARRFALTGSQRGLTAA